MFWKKNKNIYKTVYNFSAVAKKREFCLARLGIFFLPIFFSEMRSWLIGFFGSI